MIPKGYRLVPIEPTGEMKHAGVVAAEWPQKDMWEKVVSVYAAMLAAAPSPSSSDAANASAKAAEAVPDVAALTARVCELEEALQAEHDRYQWAANELLACDYGDNEGNKLADGFRPEVGWRVYGWRTHGQARIYGESINAAIDRHLQEHPEQRGGEVHYALKASASAVEARQQVAESGEDVMLLQENFHEFLHDYARYDAGDQAMPFAQLRVSLSNLIERIDTYLSTHRT